MPTLRSALIGGVAVVVLATTLAVWQGITPRSIKQSM
jgi:hypothetical protein